MMEALTREPRTTVPEVDETALTARATRLAQLDAMLDQLKEQAETTVAETRAPAAESHALYADYAPKPRPRGRDGGAAKRV